MMEQHFVTFLSPGTFVAEESTKPISAWDVEEAKAMVAGIQERHGATPYGFRFTTRRREDNELDSKVVVRSNLYYLGGKIESLAEVKARATEEDRILVRNMEGGGYDRIITNHNSYRWTQPLDPEDVVLDWSPTGKEEP